MEQQAHLAKGLWGVLATPFLESLELDEESMRRQVQLHHSVGSTGLVALGVFGESARLEPQERVRVVEVVADVAGELGLVIGLAERETVAAIDSGRALLEAADTPGAALMVQVSSADPRALAGHVAAIHEATGAPIVVQDYPLVSGVSITSANLLEAVTDCPFVVGIKSEAPPTSLAISELTVATRVPVFGGLGGLGLLDELMAGASGAMTGFSHPEGLAAALDAWDVGGYPAAREAFEPWLPLVNFEAQAGIGLAIRKRILQHRGVFTSGAVRPPAPSFPESLLPLLVSHLSAIPRPDAD
jgi:4-hydroxy-tetrahydrodipicolinate synthase